MRVFIAALFMAPYLLFHNNVIGDLLASYTGPARPLLVYADILVTIGIILWLYSLYVRWIEKRKAHELSLRGSLPELGTGYFISFCLVGGMVLLLAVLGYYRIAETDTLQVVADALFRFGIGAFLQVLFFRLILFRLVEELLGTWLSWVLTAAVFGIAHAGNENATLWTTTALILGDILLISAFIYTRRLWLVWGIHAGWNFFQDGIFGMPNSGISSFESWITPQIDGPAWITGGAFGIEASLIVVAVSAAVGLFILNKAVSKGQIVRPLWKRAGVETAAAG
jgi:membrane protease YdiL (CAAX protease family)